MHPSVVPRTTAPGNQDGNGKVCQPLELPEYLSQPQWMAQNGCTFHATYLHYHPPNTK